MNTQRALLNWLLLIALLARSAVAAGYMPAGEGRLVTLCPEGLPTALADALLSSAGHDHDDHQRPERSDHSDLTLDRCALGAAFVALGPPMAETVLPAAGIETGCSVGSLDLQPRILPAAYHARAPPLLLQQD